MLESTINDDRMPTLEERQLERLRKEFTRARESLEHSVKVALSVSSCLAIGSTFLYRVSPATITILSVSFAGVALSVIYAKYRRVDDIEAQMTDTLKSLKRSGIKDVRNSRRQVLSELERAQHKFRTHVEPGLHIIDRVQDEVVRSCQDFVNFLHSKDSVSVALKMQEIEKLQAAARLYEHYERCLRMFAIAVALC